MKNKRLIKIIVILLIYFCYLSFCYKVNAEDDITSELLKSQSSTLGISSFIEEANKYKSEDFDIDVNELITSAIKGNVDNQHTYTNYPFDESLGIFHYQWFTFQIL